MWVYTALISFIQVRLSEGGSGSCPWQGRGSTKEVFYGFDRESTGCFTFMEAFPREQYTPTMMPNVQFNKVCEKAFKNGYIFGIADRGDVDFHSYFKTMTAYSGMVITSGRRIDDEYCGWFNYWYHIWEYEFQFEDRHRTIKRTGKRGYCSKDGGRYGDYVHRNWWIYRSPDYNGQFNDGNYPKCSIVKVDSTDVYPNKVIPCSDLHDYSRIYILCNHDRYNDCVEEKVDACTYVNKSGRSGWFSFHYKITVPPDEPYGQTCKKQTVFGERCEPKCKGSWSEWSTNSGKCVDGGVFTSRRYQAMTKSDDASRCNEKSVDCCYMEKQVTVDNCFDYDATKKVKLDSTSCKNGGKLVKDAAGYNMCQCKSQYKGITCEEDACKDFCKNSGTCIARVAETICICLPGFTGTKCETPLKLCGQEKKQCANGGNCTWSSDGQSSYCKCPVQFGGDFCDIKTEYCTEKTCSNAGVCHNVTESHSFRCKCNMGRTGKRCETSSEGIGFVFGQFTEGKSAGYIYLIVGIILTLLFLTCGTGTVVHHRRRRRRRGHRRDDMSSVSSAFSSRFTSTLGRFSTLGSRKMKSRMSTGATGGSTATTKGGRSKASKY